MAESPVSGRRVTAADVARASGFSRTTVSYVLNDVAGQTIPEGTRTRIREAAAALGYVPSAAAASLRRGHSRVILVVTDNAMTGFVTEPFLAAISSYLTTRGFAPLSYPYRSDDALIALVNEIRPFGVLALTALTRETMNTLAGMGTPRVYSSAHGDMTFPRPWEEEIGAIQAAHLIANGRGKIVYAGPMQDAPRRVIAEERFRGVQRKCTDADLAPAEFIEVPNERHLARDALFGTDLTTVDLGVCAFDDTVAAVVLAAAADHGIAIPRQMSVIGVDDTPFAPLLTPPLTTVAVDGRETGLQLAERFVSDDANAVWLEPSHAIAQIVERAST